MSFRPHRRSVRDPRHTAVFAAAEPIHEEIIFGSVLGRSGYQPELQGPMAESTDTMQEDRRSEVPFNMADDTTPGTPITLVLNGPELNLVRTGLQFLLAAEDDPEEIERLKLLIARLPI